METFFVNAMVGLIVGGIIVACQTINEKIKKRKEIERKDNDSGQVE